MEYGWICNVLVIAAFCIGFLALWSGEDNEPH
jgi:hypothetical protein